MATYHPDLAARQRFLPRGLGRRWALPLLRTVFRVLGAVTRGRERVDLETCSVFVYRPRRPSDAARPGLLWIHGGGLIMGDARQDDAYLQRIADELGIVVASVQYRLAPEHPFPAPLDDCEAGFRWLAAQPDVDGTRLAVGGMSAGGGLAAALSQRLADPDDVRPSFQLLVYPMLDDRSARGTGPNDDGFRVWDRASNQLGWSSYLAGHVDPPPGAVPGRTEDLTGQPPAWIGVGTLDLFHDEDVAYAERLRAAGVAVDLDLVEGAYHGFDAVEAGADVTRRFRDAQVAALAAALVDRIH